jgi:hypothetical protein
MDERRRLEQELADMERRMAATHGAEARSLDERMAATKQALRALEQEQAAKEQAERAAAAEVAARARREALTGHSRTLVDAHHAKLTALETAESHMAAAVAAINEALQAEAAERAAAGAMATELGVDIRPLAFSRDETVRRIGGNIVAMLMNISACTLPARRLGAWALPMPDPDIRAGEGWRDREARHTSGSVEALLEHAETNTAEAA